MRTICKDRKTRVTTSKYCHQMIKFIRYTHTQARTEQIVVGKTSSLMTISIVCARKLLGKFF